MTSPGMLSEWRSDARPSAADGAAYRSRPDRLGVRDAAVRELIQQVIVPVPGSEALSDLYGLRGVWGRMIAGIDEGLSARSDRHLLLPGLLLAPVPLFVTVME